MEIIEEAEVRKMVRRECKEFGSLRAFAAHLGLTKDVRRVVIFFKP